MKQLASLALMSSLVTSITPPVGAAPAARSIDSFGAKLHAQVAKPGNLVYSPLSIAVALAMTREGARGETAAELDRVLGAGTGASARDLLKLLRSTSTKARPGVPAPPELSIANRLFADKAMPFEPAFVAITRDGYGAPIEAVDFAKQPEAARQTINTWVAAQTRDKITSLLAPGTVGPSTHLALVNAIYLKAQWATPFAVSATAPSKFTVAGAGNKQVATMRTRAPASWGSHAGARVLDLPYASGAAGPRLSMLLVVPDQAKLPELEAAYAKGGLAPFVTAASQQGFVDVALPKFQIGTDLDLGASLEAMGMKRAFSDHADFTGISKLAGSLSKVIHKAWVQVDEKGTEAAAATAVFVGETSVAARPHDFAVDRSFLFFIHDQDGTVLFGGRVLDPSA